jgi:hypothetical protein
MLLEQVSKEEATAGMIRIVKSNNGEYDNNLLFIRNNLISIFMRLEWFVVADSFGLEHH